MVKDNRQPTLQCVGGFIVVTDGRGGPAGAGRAVVYGGYLGAGRRRRLGGGISLSLPLRRLRWPQGAQISG